MLKIVPRPQMVPVSTASTSRMRRYDSSWWNRLDVEFSYDFDVALSASACTRLFRFSFFFWHGYCLITVGRPTTDTTSVNLQSIDDLRPEGLAAGGVRR